MMIIRSEQVPAVTPAPVTTATRQIEAWHLLAGPRRFARGRQPAQRWGADAIDPVAIAPRWLNWRHPPLAWGGETF
jgi:hypothetical protein